MAQTAPYGSWKSPITTDSIVADSIGLGGLWLDGDDLYWLEARPTEGGRQVLVRWRNGQTTELTKAPFNVRTRVHEYGGGAYVVAGGVAYASNFADQRLYRLDETGPVPLTPAVDLRYADAVVDTKRQLLFAIREDHTEPGQATNTIVSLSTRGDDSQTGGRVLVSGHDFYSSPRLNPTGDRLCWLAWNHPNMPWDGTELWVAEVTESGSLFNAHKVAGGVHESIFQPEWSPSAELYFVSDRTGWWNLYRWNPATADFAAGDGEPLYTLAAEFGEPAWGFRTTTYGFESAQRIVCQYIQNGQARLATLNLNDKALHDLQTPYTDFHSIRVKPGSVICVAASPIAAAAVVQINVDTGVVEVLKQSSTQKIDPNYLSIPKAIEYPTNEGLTAFGFYYAPRNAGFVAPPEDLPPLIVISHGGPTGATGTSLDLEIQFWTSRGFGVFDVNYGGSTGYGRAYRQRLNGRWGIVDVDDCVNGAQYLVGRQQADPQRLIIRGGSAGGYTTLAALTFRQVFRAGASYYGISDLETLAADTHKFESRYLDNLIGPYPADKETYVERSPIHFTQRLSCPMILFQGLEDKVVPPDQSQKMFEAVRAKELPVAYIAYAGEQHGFRQAQTIKHSLDSELYFYSKIFKFNLADPVAPIAIENLDA